MDNCPMWTAHDRPRPPPRRRPPILLRETIGAIAVLTLNRPAARNSLSEG